MSNVICVCNEKIIMNIYMINDSLILWNQWKWRKVICNKWREK